MEPTPNPMIQNLLEDLKSGVDTKRRAAAYKLGKLGEPAAIPGLNEALRDADASVRQNAATAIREIENRKALADKMAATPPVTIGERVLAVLSHLSYVLFILTPLLDYLDRSLAEIFAYVMIIAPPLFGLIIAIVFKRRSPFAASHALQAALAHPLFPILYMLVFYMSGSGTNLSSGTLVATCLFPFSMVWLLQFFVGALQAAQGKDYTYPLIGKSIKGILFSNSQNR